jgi:hypothetical protein
VTTTTRPHGGGPPPGPRISKRPRAVTLVYSDGAHARSWGWWCTLCTPADPEPWEIVGGDPVMLQGSARRVATAHERGHHSRTTQT